jgi:hypothetical protein
MCIGIGIYSITSGHANESLAVQAALLLIVTPLCGTIGGYLASRRAMCRTAAGV